MSQKPLFHCPIDELHRTMAMLGYRVSPLGVPEVLMGIQCRASGEFTINALGDVDYGAASDHLSSLGADAGLIIAIENWRFGQLARMILMPLKLTVAEPELLPADQRSRSMRLLQVLPARTARG
ncbi:MAG: hypothetical protein R3D33_17535 [Hyphomicrobiaceae bacterium]